MLQRRQWVYADRFGAVRAAEFPVRRRGPVQPPFTNCFVHRSRTGGAVEGIWVEVDGEGSRWRHERTPGVHVQTL